MANGRCRMHGGKSTGPRTAEGLAALAKARTTHGLYCAGREWDLNRRAQVLVTWSRLLVAVEAYWDWFSPELAARARTYPAELVAPMDPSNVPFAGPANETPCAKGRDARGRFAAVARRVGWRAREREAARVQAAVLAPWWAGIVAARLAKRAAATARRAARRGAGEQEPLRRGTVRPDGAEAGGAAAVAGAGGEQQPLRPGTGGRAAGPVGASVARAGLDDAARELHAMWDGAGAGAAACVPAKQDALRREAARPGMGPFRSGLLGSTAANTQEAAVLAAKVARAGGWPVLMAIDAAQQEGGDWREAAAQARRRLAVEESQRRGRLVLLDARAAAAMVRWDDLFRGG